jgi:hypothetical protein
MPRHRLLTRIDDEMVLSKASLKYWRSELLLIAGTRLEACVKRQIAFREREADELLDVQEHLIRMTDAEATARL